MDRSFYQCFDDEAPNCLEHLLTNATVHRPTQAEGHARPGLFSREKRKANDRPRRMNRRGSLANQQKTGAVGHG